jgi:tetratricopeptide (TPR) repeat protein
MHCPLCGKEIPNNSEFCLHCGEYISRDTRVESAYKIPDNTEAAQHGLASLQQGTLQIEDHNRSIIENLFLLAKRADDGRNYAQAVEYYTRILEIDPKNPDAWLEKGIDLAFTSTPHKQNFDEAMVSLDEYFAIAPDEEAKTKYAIGNLLTALFSYTISLFERFHAEVEQYAELKAPKSQVVVTGGGIAENIGAGLGAGIADGLSARSARLSHRGTLSETFSRDIAPLHRRVLRYAWNKHRDYEIAKRIYEIAGFVYSTDAVDHNSKAQFQRDVEGLLREIKNTYPDMDFPILGEETKDPVDRIVDTSKDVLKVTLIILAIILICLCLWVFSL